jgi:hypothetical protein
MMSKLLCMSFSSQAQGAANNAHGFKAPVGLTLVGVTVYPEAFTGTPTGFNLDVNVAGQAAVSAVAANTAGQSGEWKTNQFGGGQQPVAIAAGQQVTIDVNFVNGTTPTADYDVHLWLLEGAA